MSKFPFDRSWLPEMSDRLLRCAGELRVDNQIVTFEELVSSDTLLNEVRHALKRHGWPSRTPEEIRQELLRLHGRWNRVTELKMIEAALCDLPVCFESIKIRFWPTEYAYFIQVIDVRIIAFCCNAGKF